MPSSDQRRQIIAVGLLLATHSLSTVIPLIFAPDLQAIFGQGLRTADIALYFILGFGLAQIPMGWLADRLSAGSFLRLSSPLLLLSILASVITTDTDLYLACRFCEGIGSAGMVVFGRFMLRQDLSATQTARALSVIFIVISVLGTVLPWASSAIRSAGLAQQIRVVEALVSLLGAWLAGRAASVRRPVHSTIPLMREIRLILARKDFRRYGLICALSYAGYTCLLIDISAMDLDLGSSFRSYLMSGTSLLYMFGGAVASSLLLRMGHAALIQWACRVNLLAVPVFMAAGHFLDHRQQLLICAIVYIPLHAVHQLCGQPAAVSKDRSSGLAISLIGTFVPLFAFIMNKLALFSLGPQSGLTLYAVSTALGLIGLIP